MQDAHAALRFLVNDARKFGIDTSAIFIGGVNAGALTSTGISFMNQVDFDNHYPTLTRALGKIDDSTNDLNTKFTIRGVIDMWGQIPDTSLISHTEASNISLIIFHSTADSSLSPYTKAIELASRYKSLGGCYQFHTSTGTGHTEGISKYYIAEKTGCFLKSILLNSCKTFEIEVDNENITCKNGMTIDCAISHRPYINLDSLVIIEYAGEYKSKGEKIKFITENGYLFLTDEESKAKEKMYPESENDFFLRNDNIQFTFNKNKKDRVSGLTVFIDAKKIDFKRTK